MSMNSPFSIFFTSLAGTVGKPSPRTNGDTSGAADAADSAGIDPPDAVDDGTPVGTLDTTGIVSPTTGTGSARESLPPAADGPAPITGRLSVANSAAVGKMLSSLPAGDRSRSHRTETVRHIRVGIRDGYNPGRPHAVHGGNLAPRSSIDTHPTRLAWLLSCRTSRENCTRERQSTGVPPPSCRERWPGCRRQTSASTWAPSLRLPPA